MAGFNKEVFFTWIKILCIENILLRIHTTTSKFDVTTRLKKLAVKVVPINNYELLNIWACSFNVLEQRVHLISSDQLQILSSSPDIH